MIQRDRVMSKDHCNSSILCDLLCFCYPNLPIPHDLLNRLYRCPKIWYKTFIWICSWHNIEDEWNSTYEITISRSLYWPRFLMLHIKCMLCYTQTPHIFCITWFGKYELLWLFAFRLAFYSKCLFVINHIAYIFPPIINFDYISYFSMFVKYFMIYIPVKLCCLCVRIYNHNSIDRNS